MLQVNIEMNRKNYNNNKDSDFKHFSKKEDNKGKDTPFSKGGGGDSDRYLPYNKKLKQLSRNLRNDSTNAEIILWKELRAAAFGYTFNRQKPILNYIVDFYCKPLNLVIEVDGISHWGEEQQERDKVRQKELENLGLYFLRFDDNDVSLDLENVIRTIEVTIEDLEQQYPEVKRKRKNRHSNKQQQSP